MTTANTPETGLKLNHIQSFYFKIKNLYFRFKFLPIERENKSAGLLSSHTLIKKSIIAKFQIFTFANPSGTPFEG